MKLKDKVALITGGSRGIGRAVALRCAEEGADIVVNYHKAKDKAQEVVEAGQSMGRKALAIQADVTQASQVQAMVGQVQNEWGRIDILVNNAGILSRKGFFEISEEDWDTMHLTNLKSYFLVGQEVARVMRDTSCKGSILNMSSAGALRASPNLTHYCTAKAGVSMLTKQMALELAPHGIRVNELNGGLIETDLNRHDIADPEFREFRMSRIPLQIIGVPEDMAGAAVFLLSDEARLITGASLFVDAGATIW